MSAQTIMAGKLVDAALTYGHDRPHHMNRYSGGHNRKSQPYINGYWYLYLMPPGPLLGTTVGAAAASQWFHSTAESFTPPSKTVTKVDVPGMGGMASSFAAGQELSRTFTVAFREHQDLPVMKALHQWTNMIDSNTGTSPLDMFVPNEYKGQCIAVLARPGLPPGTIPDLRQIDQLFMFEGVFPETLPYDTFNTDIATNDTTQLSVTFSFDGFPLMKDSPSALAAYSAVFGLMGFDDTELSKHTLGGAAIPTLEQVSAFATSGSVIL